MRKDESFHEDKDDLIDFRQQKVVHTSKSVIKEIKKSGLDDVEDDNANL